MGRECQAKMKVFDSLVENVPRDSIITYISPKQASVDILKYWRSFTPPVQVGVTLESNTVITFELSFFGCFFALFKTRCELSQLYVMQRRRTRILYSTKHHVSLLTL